MQRLNHLYDLTTLHTVCGSVLHIPTAPILQVALLNFYDICHAYSKEIDTSQSHASRKGLSLGTPRFRTISGYVMGLSGEFAQLPRARRGKRCPIMAPIYSGNYAILFR